MSRLSLRKYQKLTLLFILCLSAIIGMAFWARQVDDFFRIDVDSPLFGSQETKLEIIGLRSKEPLPVLVFIDNTRESIFDKGRVLRRIADTGFTCAYVKLTTPDVPEVQKSIDTLLITLASHHLLKNGLVYLGNEVRLDGLLSSASHAIKQPDVLVWLADGKSLDGSQSEIRNYTSSVPVLVATQADTSRSAATVFSKLSGEGYRAKVIAVPNTGDFEQQDELIFKLLAESGRRELLNLGKISNSTRQPRRQIKHVGYYIWPTIVICIVILLILIKEKIDAVQHTCNQRWLTTGLAVVCGLAAGIITGALMIRVNPAFAILLKHERDGIRNARFLTYAKQWHVSTADCNELIDYVALADYTRNIVEWKLDERMYTEYVLNPCETTHVIPQLAWRYELWHFFYPAIRKAVSPLQAATILVQKLRLEIDIDGMHTARMNVCEIWTNRVATRDEFDLVYLAALRSIGIAAKLNMCGGVEIWDSGEWKPAPRPETLGAA